MLQPAAHVRAAVFFGQLKKKETRLKKKSRERIWPVGPGPYRRKNYEERYLYKIEKIRL